jgi:hypothetical protein
MAGNTFLYTPENQALPSTAALLNAMLEKPSGSESNSQNIHPSADSLRISQLVSRGHVLPPIGALADLKLISLAAEQRETSPGAKRAHEKRFKCLRCEFRCNDKSDLSRHTNDKHTVTKLFQCPACGRCSKQSGNLKPHAMKEHCCTLDFGSSNQRYVVEKAGVQVKVVVGSVTFSDAQLQMYGARANNQTLSINEASTLVSVLTQHELEMKADEFKPTFR